MLVKSFPQDSVALSLTGVLSTEMGFLPPTPTSAAAAVTQAVVPVTPEEDLLQTLRIVVGQC